MTARSRIGYAPRAAIARNLATTMAGIGESPASHRLMVRSSRHATSSAHRRADRPEDVITERSRTTVSDSRDTVLPRIEASDENDSIVMLAQAVGEVQRLLCGSEPATVGRSLHDLEAIGSGVHSVFDGDDLFPILLAPCGVEIGFSKPIVAHRSRLTEYVGRDCPDTGKIGYMSPAVKREVAL